MHVDPKDGQRIVSPMCVFVVVVCAWFLCVCSLLLSLCGFHGTYTQRNISFVINLVGEQCPLCLYIHVFMYAHMLHICKSHVHVSCVCESRVHAACLVRLRVTCACLVRLQVTCACLVHLRVTCVYTCVYLYMRTLRREFALRLVRVTPCVLQLPCIEPSWIQGSLHLSLHACNHCAIGLLVKLISRLHARHCTRTRRHAALYTE